MNKIQNESGKFEMVLQSAVRIPGVKIDRDAFLRKELSKFFEPAVVDNAIANNPAQAGITVKDLDRIAQACINYETMKVSAISAVAGVKGGFAMAVTVPLDTAQFFAHIFRLAQKLAYLYGWQKLTTNEEELDDETAMHLTLFVGVMFGVNAANVAIKEIAQQAAQNVYRQFARKALTKGTVYPIVKKVAAMIGIKMTKKVFAKSISKIIPVVGAVASGSVTYAIFKPMAKRLKKYLEELPLANANCDING